MRAAARRTTLGSFEGYRGGVAASPDQGPTMRDDGVLDYDLEQETINFAGLLTVDGVVDMEVRQSLGA